MSNERYGSRIFGGGPVPGRPWLNQATPARGAEGLREMAILVRAIWAVAGYAEIPPVERDVVRIVRLAPNARGVRARDR